MKEYDLARILLNLWQRYPTENQSWLKNRIRLEIDAGALDTTLRFLDQWLDANPSDPWGLEQKKYVVGEMKARLETMARK